MESESSDPSNKGPKTASWRAHTGSFLRYSDKATTVVTIRETQVVRRPQAGQGQWVTAVGGASATGVKLPPTFLFRSPVQQVVDKGFLALRTPKGWTTTEAWLEFLKKRFVPFTQTSQSNPQLLLTDGHRSCLDPSVVAWADKHGVEVFLLLPHTTHFLCPLDTHFFGPLKKNWRTARSGLDKLFLQPPAFASLRLQRHPFFLCGQGLC